MTAAQRTRALRALALFSLGAGCACSSTKTVIATSSSVCASDPSGLKIVFSPMYSAVIPGDDTHAFQIPAVVEGKGGDEVVWHVSDPTAVGIMSDTATGGVLLTMLSTAKSPGSPVTVTANTTSACGTATINITPGTLDQWNTGEARYNDRVPIDAGLRAACADCHAPRADAGQRFNDIAHTPEQAGGFSDEQLGNIIQNGVIPDGGYFDPSIVSYPLWQSFHQWNLTPDERTGVILYLRSLVPSPQMGTANFGGLDAGLTGH